MLTTVKLWSVVFYYYSILQLFTLDLVKLLGLYNVFKATFVAMRLKLFQ